MPKTPALTKLASNLKSANVQPERQGPLWSGPCDEGPNGGITFSMLSRFLSCRERFRVQFIEGIKPAERFNHRTDYGTMWHLCEEIHAGREGSWEIELHEHCSNLARKFPLQQEEIGHWYNVCKTQFPIYVEHWHWSKHPDVKKRTPLMQEQVFDVPYKLPSGRVVRLRGKFDSVDSIGGGVWLQENKTRGDVDVQAIQRQLTFDLQTMLYLIALTSWYPMGIAEIGKPPSKRHPFSLKGVRYNVVRRPLSGGKGTIIRHKPTKTNPQGESWESYYERLGGVIRENADHFFQRWNTEITSADIVRFQRECLSPILEALCNWYAVVTNDPIQGTQFFQDCLRFGHNWRHPHGSINTIDEYGSGDTDAYLDVKSMAGLRRVDRLFEELA